MLNQNILASSELTEGVCNDFGIKRVRFEVITVPAMIMVVMYNLSVGRKAQSVSILSPLRFSSDTQHDK